MSEWKQIVNAEAVPCGRIKAASVDGTKLILLKVEGRIVAYEDRCPHEQYPLSLGELDDCVLICSKHLWEFDAATGRNLSGGIGAGRDLVRYPARIVDGMIEVDIGSPLSKEGADV